MIRRAFVRAFSGARDWLLRRKREPPPPPTVWSIVVGGDPSWPSVDLPDLPMPTERAPYTFRYVGKAADGSPVYSATMRFNPETGHIEPDLRILP